MLTERDILNAWLCWGKAGRVPPPAADAGELRTKVRHMLARFLYADRNLFLAAAKMLAAAKSTDWPTTQQIEMAILIEKTKAKVAQHV